MLSTALNSQSCAPVHLLKQQKSNTHLETSQKGEGFHFDLSQYPHIFLSVSKDRIVGLRDGKITLSAQTLLPPVVLKPCPISPRVMGQWNGLQFCFGRHLAYTKGRRIAGDSGRCIAKRLNPTGETNCQQNNTS